MKEDRYTNDAALQIQRYDLGLMTPEQKAAFERALSRSPEMQKEFHNAGEALAAIYIRLSQGMPGPEKELKDILLAKINEQKPERAGILAGSTLVASLAMIPSAISDASSIPPAGDFNSGISTSAKKVVTPVIIASVVLFSCIGMNNFSLSDSANVPSSSLVQTHSESVAAMNHKFHVLPQEAGGSKRSSIVLTSIVNNVVDNNILPLQLPTKDNGEEHLRVFEISSVETLIPVITSVNPILPKQEQNVANPLDHNPIIIENGELYSETTWSERISFSISHMSTLKFYPGRLDMAPVPSMNNWGAALKYAISPVVAIGIEVGRETFPFYRERGNDKYDEFYSITWGGASVTVSDPRLEIFDCQPEARVVAGFGTAGPMGKISAGFIWQPSRTISFSPELEYTGVYIKNTGVFIEGQDGVSEGGKLGFRTSMIIRF